MASWGSKTAIAAADIDPSDIMPLLDQSAAAGSRDRVATIAALSQALGGSQVLFVAQTAHGFAVGDVLRHNGTSWVEATADTSGNAVFGGIITSVPDVDSFLLTLTGYVSGLSGLTAGSVHYLQDAGGLGTTAGTVTLPVLLAVSATAGVLLNMAAAFSGGLTPSDVVQSFTIAVSDETTDLTTGTGKVTFRMPYAFTLTAVRASVTTAPTGAALQVDINEGGVSILSTVLSIDAGEKTSTTAAAPAVISDSSLADDAEITIDIDQVGSTVAGAGLKVSLIGYRT